MEEFSDGTAYIPLSVRVVCFKACSTNGQESVITVCTNLPDSQFSTDDIKEIYRLRWQIEVNFRNLKRVLDLEWLHGRVITVCTNLPDSQFSTDDIKEIYRLRWQIEVNFRNLKRVLDLEWLHGRKQELVLSNSFLVKSTPK